MNTIKQVLMVLVAAGLLWGYPLQAAEKTEGSGIDVVAGAALRYKQANFKINGVEFTPRYTTVDLSLTMAVSDFYATINYDQSIKDYHVHDDEVNASGEQENTIMVMSREDGGLTLGYNVYGELSIFGGYLYGSTYGVRFAALDAIDSEPDRFNQDYNLSEEGPFLGASYGVGFAKGNLSVSLAYADMEGKMITGSISSRDEAKGRTRGFSYAINWSGPMTGTVHYTVGLRANRYKFEHEDVPAGEDDMSFDNNITMFTVGLMNFF